MRNFSKARSAGSLTTFTQACLTCLIQQPLIRGGLKQSTRDYRSSDKAGLQSDRNKPHDSYPDKSSI